MRLTSRVAAAATGVVLTMAAVSCFKDGGPFGLSLGAGAPINGVLVYAGSFFEVAAVGDSLAIQSFGYHDGNGFGTEWVKTAVWTSSDTTILKVTRSASNTIGSAAVITGLKAGLVTLTATLNGVTGSDTIRVLPAIKSLQVKVTKTNPVVGDTIAVWLRADDMNGDSIPNITPFIVHDILSPTSPFATVSPYRYRVVSTGSARFYTRRIGHDSAQVTVTVQPASP